MSVALASAGGERVGSGVAQAWEGDYTGAASNLATGVLQVVGGRYGLSLGGEAAGELSAASTKFGANSWSAENNGAFSIQNSGWSSEVGYSGGAFNAEGLTGRLGSGGLGNETQAAIRDRVLANISETRTGNVSNNLGGGLVTDAVAVPDHTFRRLLENRGLPSDVISEVRQSFDGQVFARHGLEGDSLQITETATGRASGIYVTRGSAGATPEIRQQMLALPPSNRAWVESPVFLKRPQILLEGVVAPQPTFGAHATGGGWQIVTDGGFHNGALRR